MATARVRANYSYLGERFDPARPRRKATTYVITRVVDLAVPDLPSDEAPVAFVAETDTGSVAYRIHDGLAYAPRVVPVVEPTDRPDVRDRDDDGTEAMLTVSADAARYLVVDGVEHERAYPALRVDPDRRVIEFLPDADCVSPGHLFSPTRPEAAREFARRMGGGPFAEVGVPDPVPGVGADVRATETMHVAGAVARDVGVRDNGHLFPPPAAVEHATILAGRMRHHLVTHVPHGDCLAVVDAFRRLVAALEAHPGHEGGDAFLARTRAIVERLAFEDEANPSWAPLDEEDASTLAP